MDIIKALNINITKKHFISIVGAGGKTTLLYYLSRKFRDMNRKILLTTTTHIYMPTENIFDSSLISDDEENIIKYAVSIERSGVYLIGSSINEEGKLKGLDLDALDKLSRLNVFDFILVEADGSKNKPIKAPTEWEPMVPESTTIMIGVIGLDSLGRFVDSDTVHRSEEFCRICECRKGDIIDEAMIAKLISHPRGLFKNVPDKAEKMVFLNKVDDIELRNSGIKIKSMIEEDRVKFVMASMKNDMYWM